MHKLNDKRQGLLRGMQQKIKDAFLRIKEELDEQRECVNQNTNEIQSNYEYMCKLDNKIEKLSERIDELTMLIKADQTKETEKYSVSTLTKKEQEVFMAIYLNESGASYTEISKRTGLTENLVICYITNLVAKGVPLVKKYLSNGVRVYLDNEFRKIQAQKNILQIPEHVARSII